MFHLYLYLYLYLFLYFWKSSCQCCSSMRSSEAAVNCHESCGLARSFVYNCQSMLVAASLSLQASLSPVLKVLIASRPFGRTYLLSSIENWKPNKLSLRTRMICWYWQDSDTSGRNSFDAFLTDKSEANTALLSLERPPCLKALVSAAREGHSEVPIQTPTLISEKVGSSWGRGEGEGAGVAEANWATDPGNARFCPRKAQALWTWQGGSNIWLWASIDDLDDTPMNDELDDTPSVDDLDDTPRARVWLGAQLCLLVGTVEGRPGSLRQSWRIGRTYSRIRWYNNARHVEGIR